MISPADLLRLASVIRLDDYRGECTHEEIARVMGISKATVMKIERQALSKLRQLRPMLKDWI